MVNKERPLIYSIVLFLGLCLYSYYWKKYEIPLLPEPKDDVEWHIRGMLYPFALMIDLIIALLFYLALKLIYLIRRRFKSQKR